MLIVATSNLLAERPYSKIRGGVVQGPILPLEVRLLLFKKYLEKRSDTDVFLFQEIDNHWENALKEFSQSKGYSFIVRPCRKLKIGIVFKSNRFENCQIQAHHKEAGFLSIDIFDKSLNTSIRLVNVHADWGKAKDFANHFHEIFQTQGEPIIIGGDFNLDNILENENKSFFDELIYHHDYMELSSEVPFTAKYVKNASQAVKLDLLVSKNIQSYSSVSIYPEDFNKLLPHTIDPLFNPKDPNNHYSDHVILTCSVSYAS
jgi:hypothetical protein